MVKLEVVLGEYALTGMEYDSLNELKMHLAESKSDLVLISDEGVRGVIFLRLRSLVSSVYFFFGIGYYGPNPPQIGLLKGDSLIVGFDNKIFVVSVPQQKIVYEMELPYVFYSFCIRNTNDIIVLHELGAICIDSNYKLKWQTSITDILQNFYIQQDQLYLETVGGERKTIKL